MVTKIKKKMKEEWADVLLSLGAVILLFLVFSCAFDFYYDFNDDVLIKDIISGRYSGKSDGHSVQMLYVLGGLLAGIYDVIPGIPWFAVFLYICFGGGLYLIIRRSITFVGKMWGKVLLVGMETIMAATLMLWELVFVQYTVVCGFLVATAIFLFYTTPNGLSLREFFRKNILTVLLVVLAFCVRTEMTLLLSPFIAAAGVFHWSNERPFWSKVNLRKYLGIIGAVLIGCFIGLTGDKLAYSSDEWKGFLDFFDARTQLYDYSWYPNYDNTKEFYDKAGVTKAQYQLIDTYNYSLDESIDVEFLNTIAEYGEKQRNNGSLTERFTKAVRELIYRTPHVQDAPYNYFVIAGYVFLLILACLKKDLSYIWKLPLLGVCRCVPWMYLIISDRVPQRIWHPLYWVELILLLAVIIKQISMWENANLRIRKLYCTCMFLVLLVFAVVWLPDSWKKVQNEEHQREQINAPFMLLNEYAKAHPENYYFIDVYSSVYFTEKSFKNVDTTHKNYDILGGWIAKSPLQLEALTGYAQNTANVREMLLQDNCYFVINNSRSMDFLVDFYGDQEVSVTLEPVEVLGSDDSGLVVYQVKEE